MESAMEYYKTVPGDQINSFDDVVRVMGETADDTLDDPHATGGYGGEGEKSSVLEQADGFGLTWCEGRGVDGDRLTVECRIESGNLDLYTKRLGPLAEEDRFHTYPLLEGPGHSWLKVPFEDIVKVGAADSISSYSYVEGNMVYLEEDADMTRFLEAAQALGWEVNWKRRRVSGYEVRGLASYEVSDA